MGRHRTSDLPSADPSDRSDVSAAVPATRADERVRSRITRTLLAFSLALAVVAAVLGSAQLKSSQLEDSAAPADDATLDQATSAESLAAHARPWRSDSRADSATRGDRSQPT